MKKKTKRLKNLKIIVEKVLARVQVANGLDICGVIDRLRI